MRTGIVVLALALVGCSASPTRDALPPLRNLAQPADGVVTSGRITAAEIDALRAAGIREVIDLTTEEESPDLDEAAVVAGAGLRYKNLPVHGADGLTRDNVMTFDAMLREAEQPVLVHCGSSNRVGAMAALRAAWVEGKAPEAAIATGRAWGLKGLEPEVRRVLAGEPAPER